MGFKSEMDDVKDDLTEISRAAIARNFEAVEAAVKATNTGTGLSADEAASSASRLALGALQDLAKVYEAGLKVGKALDRCRQQAGLTRGHVQHVAPGRSHRVAARRGSGLRRRSRGALRDAAVSIGEDDHPADDCAASGARIGLTGAQAAWGWVFAVGDALSILANPPHYDATFVLDLPPDEVASNEDLRVSRGSRQPRVGLAVGRAPDADARRHPVHR